MLFAPPVAGQASPNPIVQLIPLLIIITVFAGWMARRGGRGGIRITGPNKEKLHVSQRMSQVVAELDVHGNVEVKTESVLDNAIKEKSVIAQAAGIDLSGVQELLSLGKKLEAIKLYREQAGIGFKEAKDAVDAIERGDVFDAAKRGKINAIDAYIKSGGNIDAKDKNGTTPLDEALVAVLPNGREMYEKDKDQALRLFEGKGFPNPGLKEQLNVRWFLDMSKRADDSSLWDEAWGGYHHALAGAVALNMAEQVPDICWHLGRAQTGRAQYDLAALYLETAYNLSQRSKNRDLTCRALLEVAVVGKLAEKPDAVNQAYQRAETFLFPSGGDTTFAAKMAKTLFQEGGKNQEWRLDDKPVRYCLVHASGFYQVSLDINRRLNEKRGISIILINLGDVWRKLGQRDRALACWQESIPILKELQDQRNIDIVKGWINET